MFKTIINDETEIKIETINGEVILNNNLANWDIVRVNERMFHIIEKHKSYKIEVIKKDDALKEYQIKVNNTIYKVNVKDNTDLLLSKLGMGVLNNDTTKEVKAPMPGLILQIMVCEGQVVKKGDPVLILEAMKMENVLKSPADGTIKSIIAEKGRSVEKNQILIQF